MVNPVNENISGFEKIGNTITTHSNGSPMFLAAVGLILAGSKRTGIPFFKYLAAHC